MIAILTLLIAQSFSNITQVIARGTGCHDTNTSSTISPGGDAVSILFDEFQLSTQDFVANKLKVQRTCSILIRGTIPAGKQITNVKLLADYRGYVSLARGMGAGVQLEMLPWNQNGRQATPSLIKKKWTTRYDTVDEDFTLTDQKSFNHVSRCSRSAQNFEIRIRQVVFLTGRERRDALFIMDSLDSESQIRTHVNMRPCRTSTRPRPRPRRRPRRRG